MKKLRLSPIALGLSLGIISALSVLIMALLIYYMVPEGVLTATFGSYHLEYKHTMATSLIGVGAAFLHAFIGGLLIGWLYNLFLGD